MQLELLGPLDSRDPLDYKAHEVIQEQLVLSVPQALMEAKETSGTQAPRDHRGSQDHRGHLGSEVMLALQATQVLWETQGLLDLQVSW